MTISRRLSQARKLPSQFTAAFAISCAVVLVWLSNVPSPNIVLYVVFLSSSAGLVWLGLRQTALLDVRLVVSVTVTIQLVGLFGNAAFEDDWYRFVWDGWQTLQSGTPYGKPPSDWFAKEGLPSALSSVLDRINNPEIPTIYGPVLQVIFAAIYAGSHGDPLALRSVMALVNIGLVALIIARGTPTQGALFGWSPFVLAETVIHIHPDGIMALSIMGAVFIARKRPISAGVLFGVAAGTKIVALAAWPLLLRLGVKGTSAAIATLACLYAAFAVQGAGVGLESTSTFAGLWLFNPLGYSIVAALLPEDLARWSVAIVGLVAILILHGRTRRIEDAPLALIFGAILYLAPAVNPWYLIWTLPFAVRSQQVWPFATMIALPLSYITGQNLGSDTLELFETHTLARIIQISIILTGIAFDGVEAWRIAAALRTRDVGADRPKISNPNIAIIIPALNEERSIGKVVSGLLALDLPGTTRIFVGDNGSIDATSEIARRAGAEVIWEPNKGYGSACLAALSSLPENTDIVLFVDADGSDTLNDAHKLIAPIMNGQADIVIGSRALGVAERGALSLPQRFGNQLATFLIWLFWGVKMTDLGPFRAVRRDTLDGLVMADRDFGWTVEMQVKAARQGCVLVELPTDYLCRIGISKISGTIKGVMLAGTKILYVIGREAFLR